MKTSNKVLKAIRVRRIIVIAFMGLIVCPLSNVNAQGVGIGITTPLNTLDVSGSAGTAISAIAISSATLLDATMSTVIATPSSAYTITLPTLSTSTRRIYTVVYNGAQGTNTITISGNGANIISGGFQMANYLLFGGTVTIQNNGANWYITSATMFCSGAPAMPGAITGSTSVCANGTGNVYSVPAVSTAAIYNWTLPTGAYITAGQGTNTITVTFGSSAGNITVSASNGCGTSSASTPLSVTIYTPTISLDATSNFIPSTTDPTSTFTINTTNPNEIILLGLSGCCAPFNGSAVVTNAGTVTQVTTVDGSYTNKALLACVATATGSHTITVTWGTNWGEPQSIAYAASYSGFCGTPTIAANVQSVIAVSNSTTTISGTITPAVANSCLFADYMNFIRTSPGGIVTWTNDNLIQTNHFGQWDGSIANKQLAATSSVTVAASDNIDANCTTCISMILAVVHP